MENIWGRLKEPQNITLYTGVPTDEGTTDVTKATIRQKVWEFLERNDIANFPRPVYNRIPNFKGASAAGDKVSTLPEFRDAKTIKVNPDKPQEQVRFRVLDGGKTLIVPTPRLTQGLFNRLEAEPDCTKESLRKMSSRYGIDSLSKPIPMASRLKLDLVVIGSVAVDRLGRRIGKGEGFADLEWAMAASHHYAVTQETVVISTVHDVQVFDALPQCLFSAHDLPVDIIVTPTEVIRVSDRLQKPDHIQWDILTREKFEQIGVLKELQFREKKAGRCVKLADGFEDVGPTRQLNNSDGESNRVEANGLANELERNVKRSQNQRRIEGRRGNNQRGRRNRKNDGEENTEQNAITEKPISKRQHERAKNKRNPQNSRNQESIGIFVGRIPRTARVKELKEAIQERGLRTNNLVWKGVKGFAFLYFDKAHTNLSEEEICLQLKDLKLGDSILNIEPDKRKDKNKDSTENVQEKDNELEGAEHMDVGVHTTEVDTIRKETSRKPHADKSQNGKTGPSSLSDKEQDKGESRLEEDENAGSIDSFDSSANVEIEEEQALIDLETSKTVPKNIDTTCVAKEEEVDGQSFMMEGCTHTSKLEIETKEIETDDLKSGDKETENTTLHNTSLDVNNTAETKIDSNNASTNLTSVDSDQTNSDAKDFKSSDKPKLDDAKAVNEKSIEDQVQSTSKETNPNNVNVNENTQKSNVSSAEGDEAYIVINEKEPKKITDDEEVPKQGNELKDLKAKVDDTPSTKPENVIEKHPQVKEASEDNKKIDSKPESSSISSDKITDMSKHVSTKEEAKSSETQQVKKDEKAAAEKGASKTDSGATKKEKSKSPDKEVKKEDGSGGGFFKRFWK